MECSPITRLMFVGMWNFADDCGRLPFSTKTIKAQIFPSDDISLDTISGMIQELSKNGLILHYSVANKDYFQITGWHHQRIDKPQPAKYPAPINGYSKTIPGTFATEGIGEEGKREEKKDSEADASDAGASVVVDHRKRLFNEGLQKLAAITGKGPDACRSFVGKCLKAASDDAVTVLGLIEEAERNQAIDPAAWIAARLKPAENGYGKTQPQSGGSILAVIDRRLAEIAREGELDPALPTHSVLQLPARSVR